MNQLKVFLKGLFALWCFLILVNGNHSSRDCDNEYDYYKDPSDPRLFYICLDGQKRILYCKEGEEFSITDTNCVKYTTEKQLSKNPLHFIGDCEKNGVHSVDPNDSKHFYLCLNNKQFEFNCKKGEEFSISDATCVKNDTTKKHKSKHPLDPVGRCEEHGVYSIDPADSSHFYKCMSGNKFGFYCKEDEEFSISDSTCVKYITVQHTGNNPEEHAGSCEQNYVYSVNPADPRHFYFCFNRIKVQFYCKEGEKFSIPDEKCIKDTTVKHISEHPFEPVGSCEEHGVYSIDPSDSRHFYHCWDGEKREFYCKEGEKFSMADQTCVRDTTVEHISKHPFEPVGSCEEHGVYSIDPSDSRHFYHCWDGEKREFYCKEGEKFSMPDQTCVRDTTVEHISKHPFEHVGSCEEHGVYSIDPSDSRHFYHCWDGEKREFYCKEGEKFSMPDQTCVRARVH